MRSLLLLFIITLTAFSTKAQTIEGTYANKWEGGSGEAIAYSLTLNDEGTFSFTSTRTFLDNVPDKRVEAIGTWTLDGHLLVLCTDNKDTEMTPLQSQLHLNKARFISISPRNPKFNILKPSIKFYTSEVFYAKDMELVKTELEVSSSK